MVTAIAGMVASGPCRLGFRSPGGLPSRHGSPWNRHGSLNDGIQQQGAVLLSLILAPFPAWRIASQLALSSGELRL